MAQVFIERHKPCSEDWYHRSQREVLIVDVSPKETKIRYAGSQKSPELEEEETKIISYICQQISNLTEQTLTAETIEKEKGLIEQVQNLMRNQIILSAGYIVFLKVELGPQKISSGG